MSKPNLFALFLMMACALVTSVPATVPSKTASMPARYLQQASAPFSAHRQQQLTRSRDWQAFVARHGPWAVQWNEVTQTPHRAFGPPIPLRNVTALTRQNVVTAARAFLDDNRALIGASSDQLELVQAQLANEVWYLSFVQTVEGVQVLFSEVELRLHRSGKVMALGADVFREVEVSLQPAISYQTAVAHAIAGIEVDQAPVSEKRGQRFILPVAAEDGLDFHLVYQIDRDASAQNLHDAVFVDAHDGEIVWQHDKVKMAEVHGSVSGQVQLELATDPFVARAFANQLVLIGDQALVSDRAGEFSVDIAAPVNLSTSLRGPYVDVIRQDGADATITTTAGPGDTLALHWDDSNSHPAERDAFYHVNLAHDFITDLDSNFTRLDYSLPCVVNRTASTCNAFWDGNAINFDRAGGGCASGAQIAIVVYHEYGHAINDRFYQQAGKPLGMLNIAVHEAMADVFSVLLEDNPIFATGFFGPGTFTRRLDMIKRYPQDIVPSSPHLTGLILSSAFWELRQTISAAQAHRLAHFAKYGTPDDLDLAVAYSEWFLEVLIADDDDGDLTNGTPHSSQIIAAFAKRGIGPSLFVTLSFDHEPIATTMDTLNAYPIDFSLTGAPFAGSEPQQVTLHYSADNFGTIEAVSATPGGEMGYRAGIPPQPAGTIVRYFMSAVEPIAGTRVVFPAQAPGSQVFSFAVGFETVVSEDFEAESGWQVGAADDDAISGIWQRAAPQATSNGYLPVQPGEDHSRQGRFCFVTGAASGPNVFSQDLDQGKTTLFSPLFDLTEVNDPYVQYYKWYSNDAGPNPAQDFWRVDISNDGGRTWKALENTSRSTPGWKKELFKISDFVAPSARMQFRFIASDAGPGSLVEALVDDFALIARPGLPVAVRGPDDGQPPQSFSLVQNYPNPFNPSTTIEFSLAHSSLVHLTIFDLTGKRVRQLHHGSLPAGRHRFTWEATNDAGEPVAGGVYLYRLQAGDHLRAERKLLLLR